MNYQNQIDKVVEYIGKHLDEKLTLAQLSDIACFSKYHFHRLFTAYTGLSLQQYIRWLRLKRAAIKGDVVEKYLPAGKYATVIKGHAKICLKQSMPCIVNGCQIPAKN